MKVEIHHIPTEGLVLEAEKEARHFAGLKALMESGEGEFTGPLAIHLEIVPWRDFIRVKGQVRTTIRQACVRCLDVFESPLQSRFTLNYSKEIPKDVHRADTDGIELTADQIGMIFFEGEQIDFTDALQEQVILALPFNPVCKSGCRGLCPHCGNNLNVGTCQCAEKEPEGPFAVLKDLKLPLKK